MAFPPNLPNIEHVVINSAAQEELALRTGISSIVIPNVLDFENPPAITRQETDDFRKEIGLTTDDILILQPTRVVRRKGIEHAIELVEKLGDPRCKLVISHEAGDEGSEYADWLKEHARESGVDLRLLNLRISDPMNPDVNRKDLYTLWEVYPHSDFITYPSLYEGFGNALLEAIYFKKPILINRYSTFIRDIEPKGFKFVVMDRFLTSKIVQRVKDILESPERKKGMVDLNYNIACRHYSFTELRKYLSSLMVSIFGVD